MREAFKHGWTTGCTCTWSGVLRRWINRKLRGLRTK